eukprot:3396587-Karenia_brevis.AAC.1
MEYVAERIARRKLVSKADVVKRWRSEISSILATRRARMARSCLPRGDARAAFIAFGHLEQEAVPE